MTVIDLSQTISTEMPVYPGTEGPRIEAANTIEREGFAEKLLSFYSHTGTHIDAPAHMLPGRPCLDNFDAGKFFGRACLIDLSGHPGGTIAEAAIEAHEARIAACDFVLLRTGWSSRWGKDGYFSDFPVLSEAAVARLCGHPLKGVGVDCISVDPVGSEGFPIHRLLFARDLIIIENLCNLDRLPQGEGFLFSCLPLAIRDADGSPVRAVGIIGIRD